MQHCLFSLFDLPPPEPSHSTGHRDAMRDERAVKGRRRGEPWSGSPCFSAAPISRVRPKTQYTSSSETQKNGCDSCRQSLCRNLGCR